MERETGIELATSGSEPRVLSAPRMGWGCFAN